MKAVLIIAICINGAGLLAYYINHCYHWWFIGDSFGHFFWKGYLFRRCFIPYYRWVYLFKHWWDTSYQHDIDEVEDTEKQKKKRCQYCGQKMGGKCKKKN